MLLQAFARPELIINTDEFIPETIQEDQTVKWLEKWNFESIGNGFFQPELKEIDAPRKPNNVLVILMNRNDEFLIEDQRKQKEDVKQIVKNYLLGINPDGKKGADYVEKEIPFIGKMKVSKGIIMYQHDLASSEEMIKSTLRSIGEACLGVRKEKAQILFGKDYFDLDDKRQEAVDMAVPVWFSYKNPKPSPSVWLPFDGKPSSEPKPINIFVKNNGEVVVENQHYKSLDVFYENIKIWNEELSKFNEGRRSKAFYRANLTFEDLQKDEYEKINLALYRNNIHVGNIKGLSSKRNLVSLENDKLKAKVDQISSETENTNQGNIGGNADNVQLLQKSSSSQKESKCIKVHLNKNKLNFKGKFCRVEDLKVEVDSHIKENPDVKVVELILHQPDELSKEIVEKVKKELKKVEDVEIKEMTVIVMDIKKKKPPPPPPPIFLLKLYSNKITLWNEEIAMSDVSKKASEFIKKTEKNAIVRVDKEKDVSDERINAIKEELRKAGALNVNLRTMK